MCVCNVLLQVHTILKFMYTFHHLDRLAAANGTCAINKQTCTHKIITITNAATVWQMSTHTQALMVMCSTNTLFPFPLTPNKPCVRTLLLCSKDAFSDVLVSVYLVNSDGYIHMYVIYIYVHAYIYYTYRAHHTYMHACILVWAYLWWFLHVPVSRSVSVLQCYVCYVDFSLCAFICMSALL